MGQKVQPTGLRIGIIEGWRSRWVADKKTFGKYLVEDQKIRNFVHKEYGFAGVSKIEIERLGATVKITLLAARPGLIIGRHGAKRDKLSEDLEKLLERTVDLTIIEIQNPEIDANVVAQSIAEQLEKRAPFRRVLRKHLESVTQAGGKGVKIKISGRLGGREIASKEMQSMGSVPLHTLRARIDYGFAVARTQKGAIGVKVWIYTGEVLDEKKEAGV